MVVDLMTVDDLEALHGIIESIEDDDHRLQNLVGALVLSDFFGKR